MLEKDGESDPTGDVDLLSQYARIVEGVIFAGDELQLEEGLERAFELGRRLVVARFTPDDIASLHLGAVELLGVNYPELALSRVAPRIELPLLNLTMAHGMAFREQVEQRYRAAEQANRLEGLRTLAAGIAHDFNNLIGSITGFAEITGDYVEEGSLPWENLHQIQIACKRASDLVSRMLCFARQVPSLPIQQDLAEQVREALAIVRPRLGKLIDLRFENALPATLVLAEAGQVQQIVINLCLNAIEAIGEGGHIEVTLQSAAGCSEVPEGRENDVCLVVRDNGEGMSQDVMQKVFDPFFTTKRPGGSGLGLSMIYSIVKQMRGEIVISSQTHGAARGTAMAVFLPPATSIH